jgi:hypothetical protein
MEEHGEILLFTIKNTRVLRRIALRRNGLWTTRDAEKFTK